MNSFVIPPCPCCGYAKTRLTTTAEVQFLAPSIGIFDLVHCPADTGGCGMASGWYDTPEEAVAGWSQRTGLFSLLKAATLDQYAAWAIIVMILLLTAVAYFRPT